MSDAHEPLEPELRALLDRERAASPPDAALERIRSRVALSVSASPEGGGRTVDRTAALSPAARALILSALGVGGVLGAGLHALLRPQPGERIVYVERPTLPPVGTAATASASIAPQGPASSSPPIAPAAPAVGAPRRQPQVAAVPAASSLLAERTLLDGARDALAQGDAPRSLALVDEHARTFARPLLAEEREALAVQALVIAGRYAEARTRGAQLRATWPSSLFLPAVDASLASIP